MQGYPASRVSLIKEDRRDSARRVVAHTPGHIGCSAPECDIPKSYTGRLFGRGLHNRGDFLYAFSQSKELFIAEWKDVDLGL